MSRFKRSSLQYEYDWPLIRISDPTTLDDDIIDTRNGYHVLNYINVFFENKGLTTISTFNRLEYLLKKQLPITLETRKEITSWVLKNWDRKFYK